MKNTRLLTVCIVLAAGGFSYTRDMRVNVFKPNIIDDPMEKRWIAPVSLYKGLAYNGFGNDNQLRPLSCVIFGKEFTIQDIFLASKLSNDNKMRNANIDALNPIRPGGSSNVPFGNYRSDQYLAALAPTKVNIEAEQRNLCTNLGVTYNFFWDKEETVVGSIGANVPIKSSLHLMDLDFSEGTLLFQNLPLGDDTAQTLLTQFFKDFINVKDFFERAVLGSKGLKFHNRQRKVGVGDVSIYCLADWGHYLDYMDALQLGVNVVLPSGNKRKGDKVWEVELGNGGAVQVEGSVTMLFNSPSPVFNPVVRLAGQVSVPLTAPRRVPKLRKQANDPTSVTPRVLIREFEDLLVPIETFRGYYHLDPFEEYDSSVLEFADLAVKTRVRYGSQFLISVGNYFYNVMNLGLRFGAFYDFMHKGKDSICTVCDSPRLFNTCLLEERTNQRFHRFGWNMTYKFDNMVEINTGSQHILAGRNIPRTHEMYISVVAVF
ncbi:hypothetical protein KC460_05080 [Candidatus Dependentiae bacterium]|nr:hypothetical protein [Candidatus Dependentiae bacterium]